MGFMTLILILSAIIVLLTYIFLVFHFNYWKKRGINGPKPKLLVGNVPSLLTQSRNIFYDLQDIYREYKNEERFAGIFNMRSPQLLITDPKLCQEILVTNFKNFHDNEFGKFLDNDRDPILARNPFFLTGSEWKEKRAEVTPALTANRIKASYPVMQEVCKKMTKYLKTEVEKPMKDGLNAKLLAAKFTSEVVANCIYGIEAGAFSDSESKIQQMGTKIFDNSLSVVIYFMLTAMIPSISNIYKIQIVKNEITKFFTELMEQAISLRKRTKSNRVDFLNYLLQLQDKKNLSSLDMAAHTMTFFLDGFETSSIVISNCLYLLAENPDIQQKLRNELNAAADKDGSISYEKLLDLPYLDQCMNETLRLRTPVLFNTKLCTETCEIRTKKDKTLKLKKGDVLVLPYYAYHTDSEFYANPEKFDPDRFSPENGGVAKYKDMGVFLPFGDGPRVCLGMRFGVCQSKAAVAEIVRNCEVSVNPKTKPKFVIDPKQFMCLPEGGVWLDLKNVSL